MHFSYFFNFPKGPPASDPAPNNPFDKIRPHGTDSRTAKGLEGAEIQIGSVWLQFVPEDTVAAEGIANGCLATTVIFKI